MTREDWARFEEISRKPDVRLAMKARCEEQGHEYESTMSFMPLPVAYRLCKWCGDRK